MIEARKQPTLYVSDGCLIARCGNNNNTEEAFDMEQETSAWFSKSLNQEEGKKRAWNGTRLNQISIPITCIRNVSNGKLPLYSMETAITNKPVLHGNVAQDVPHELKLNRGNLEKGRKNRLKHLVLPEEKNKLTGAQLIAERKNLKIQKAKEQKLAVLTAA
jgi:hypothetical protein